MKWLILLAVLLFVGCDDGTDSSGNFKTVEKIGVHNGITFYRIDRAGFYSLYYGVRESDSSLISTSYKTSGKSAKNVPLIMINGVEVSKDDALKLLNP
jgi:hypothetical protein